MLAVVRGEVGGCAQTASPESLLDTLVARTSADPDTIEALNSTAHPVDSRLGEDRLPALARTCLDLLSPLLNQLAGPWPAADFRRRAWVTAWLAWCDAESAGAPDQAGLAFVGGALLRVGQLGLCAHFPKGYARVMATAPIEAGGVMGAERRIFGVDHALAGRRMLESWGVAVSVSDALRGVPHAGAARGASASIRRADQVARRAAIGWPDYLPLGLEAADETAFARLNRRLADAEAFAKCVLATGDASPTRLRTRTPPQEETRGSRARDAVLAFLREPSGVDVNETCAAIARSARTALRAPVAVAFALDHHARVMPAVLVDDAVTRLRLTRHAEIDQVCAAAARRIQSGGSPLGAAPVGLMSSEALRLSRLVHSRPPLMLCLVQGDCAIGGVVVPDQSAGEAPSDPGDAALMASAYAHMLAVALDVQRYRRQMESLASADAQRQALERAAHQAARLQAMATLAAGAAHELNSPLAVIAGRADMLQDEPASERTKQDLATIAQQARRASDIVRELLACAKPDPPRPVSIPLAAWADRLRQHWQSDPAGTSAQIDVRISDAFARVFADPDHLRDAAGAIIANALAACSPNAARVTINSDSRTSDETIVVSIADNGRGMSPEVLAHACDPFFSDRPAGRGRGLGLSRATRLIEINGGRLWIDSTPGEGTTVHVALPAAAPSQRPS